MSVSSLGLCSLCLRVWTGGRRGTVAVLAILSVALFTLPTLSSSSFAVVCITSVNLVKFSIAASSSHCLSRTMLSFASSVPQASSTSALRNFCRSFTTVTSRVALLFFLLRGIPGMTEDFRQGETTLMPFSCSAASFLLLLPPFFPAMSYCITTVIYISRLTSHCTVVAKAPWDRIDI
ncbi:hypothetical protein F5888DRAFT_973371 [Russula emetica]|nr:hypothetical protein F5888DRAFT_973371 [Russula emetica]